MEKMWRGGHRWGGDRWREGVRWTGERGGGGKVDRERGGGGGGRGGGSDQLLSAWNCPSSLFLSLFLSPSLSLSQIKNALLARCTVHVYSAHVQPRLIKKRKEF